VEAAKNIGLATVPCIRAEHLNGAQKRAFTLADNRLTEEAEWNFQLLAKELQFLSDLEFNIELTGFSSAEIDLIIDDGKASAESDPADHIPAPRPGRPSVTRPGDRWILGRHHLLCGDAALFSTFERVLAGSKAQMVFTDPPYNVPIAGHASGLGRIQHREFAMAAGEMSDAQFARFLAMVLGHAAEFSVDGAIHFVFTDWRHLLEILVAGGTIYSELKNVCVWNKSNGGMGSLYRSKHELVFVWKVGNGPHINNIDLGRTGRYRTNVWDYPGVNSFNSSRKDELEMHPTMKPVALVADAIRDCSKRNGLVLDPFAGSGTTIMAAEKTGRRAAAIELDPAYVDTAIRRWQTATGGTAIHAGTRTSFTEIERDIVSANDANTAGWEGYANER
jgi:DNA modification methylase